MIRGVEFTVLSERDRLNLRRGHSARQLGFRYTKETSLIKIMVMTKLNVNSVTFLKCLLVQGCLMLSLSPSASAQKRDIPTNTIVGSSGKKAKVTNRSIPKSTKKNIKVYKYSSDGTASFSDRPPKGQAYEVLSYKCFACDVNSPIDWHSIKLYPNKYAGTINAAAQQYGVDAALVRAIVHAESAFRPTIKSHKGAVGLMQLMPATALELGVTDRTDPVQNIHGGVKYLAQLISRFSGDVRLATAAYNAGPGAVSRHGGVPPYAETKAYIKRVAILSQRYRTK